jgi:hypothetical protein
MTDTVRCPACRGAKKIPKLGGMIGECNTCKGKGTILAVDKPKPVVVEPVISSADIIKSVSDCLPTGAEIVNESLVLSKPVPVNPYKDITTAGTLIVEPDVKVNPKRTLYRRKKD